jgi:hypothetical protein
VGAESAVEISDVIKVRDVWHIHTKDRVLPPGAYSLKMRSFCIGVFHLILLAAHHGEAPSLPLS